ncbi:MAG: hypothetical protein M0Q22_11150 [Sulfuritalea sp.]|jgi:hypothetical protein|nr:hypothetical protein [Sulfuritalea sp.]
MAIPKALRILLVQCSVPLLFHVDLIWVNILCNRPQMMKSTGTEKMKGIYHAALLRFRLRVAGLPKCTL